MKHRTCQKILPLAALLGIVTPIHARLAAQQLAVDSPRMERTSALLNRPVVIDLVRVTVKQAVDALAAAADVRIVYKDQSVNASHTVVSLHATRMSLGTALAHVLQGTGLGIVMATSEVISLEPVSDPSSAPAALDGRVTGLVRDAQTKQPLRGVVVLLDDAKHGVTTDDAGAFQLSGVHAGAHVLHVRKLSYAKRSQAVTVADGEVSAVTIALEPSVNALEQVVVTGTVVATELKAVPNAITIITAKELRDRGITRINQLFRGDVPGLFAQRDGVTAATGGGGSATPGKVNLYSRGFTNLPGIAGGQETIKTYVDGVELANRDYLSLIDPTSIERIEIITGPQASTIYGSNAINGVMQIFTKRGSTPRPQMTAEFRSAWTQNNYSSTLAPHHVADLSASGVSGAMSYNVGGSWGYTGSWSPSVKEQTVSGFAGERYTIGALTLDGHLRVYQDRNFSNSSNDEEALRAGGPDGPGGYIGGTAPVRRWGTSTDRAAGLTSSYALTPWWSHTVTLGLDQLGSFSHIGDKSYQSPSDTAFFLSRSTVNGVTAAYNTTLRVPLARLANVVLTLGVDESHTASNGVFGSYLTVKGAYRPTGGWTYGQVQAHEHGGFLQSQVGMWDALFLTYGVRAVYNPNIGADQNPNWEPRYGVAYSRDIAGVTAKVRASYGTATRPPLIGQKDPVLDPYAELRRVFYGVTLYQVLPNPDLLPSSQQGGEGGLELYVGNRGSLQITRYNQTVDHLVVQPIVDSVDLLPAVRAQYGIAQWKDPFRMRENINIGSVRNQGWEGTGTLNLGVFTATGTYSWNKSRLIGITPKYRKQFPQFVVGAPVADLPEHTYAVGLAYVHGGTRVSYNLQGQASRLETDFYPWAIRTGNYSPRFYQLYQSRANFPAQIPNMRPGYYLSDVNMSQHVNARVDVLVQINNVHNSYQGDAPESIPQAGRTTGLGLRLSL